MQDQGHMFSLKAAAEACEVAPITLRRRIKSGELPNAFKATVEGSETWQIPLSDLIAAGFPPSMPARLSKNTLSQR